MFHDDLLEEKMHKYRPHNKIKYSSARISPVPLLHVTPSAVTSITT